MVYLERHIDEDNLHRYYAVDIDRDLFGTWVLMRRWGRIGRHGGQSLTKSFPSETEAIAEQDAWQKAKLKRGYG
ncbi:WGR domain-containing protein [Pseudohalocynthiibacter sp. F2068]|jgi:predicted DNA-binding WGR domain protein|uniref:WGR domain-containing protein n=1 Tax=Pseudohalocynthiibacter sp. F2068 TaxID=2926418 RepID=UPI001FF63785|nr:WGR domain-containing protein [Pseudohalocynthiibacter sp. F2068]MCK0103904.1 WGR domain-containing protein [Pseudohalocynthiibacter sp. F2068]